jgi:hypothetical protein
MASHVYHASQLTPKKFESVPPILRHKSPICNLAEHLIAERPEHVMPEVGWRDSGVCCSRSRKCSNLGITACTWRGYGWLGCSRLDPCMRHHRMEESTLDSTLGNAYLIDKARHVLGVPPRTVEFNIDCLSIDAGCYRTSD